MIKDEKGHHVDIQNPQNCTACNDCVHACKFQALSLIKRTEK